MSGRPPPGRVSAALRPGARRTCPARGEARPGRRRQRSSEWPSSTIQLLRAGPIRARPPSPYHACPRATLKESGERPMTRTMSFADTVRRTCPTCGAASIKALYMGVPLRLCEDETCETGWGPGRELLSLVPVEADGGGFMFWTYDGPYPL